MNAASALQRAAAIVFVLASGAMAGAGCARQEPAPQVVPAVVLAQAVPAAGTDVAAFAGEVRPRHEADLGFRIGGKIVARRVDVGMRVNQGQPLARLDPSDVALQAQAAKSAVAAAETEARFAKAEYERFQDLHRQKFVSESALDQKRNAFEANQAKYEQAKANLAVTQNQAGYATLVAPDAGVITAIFAEAGQVVAAGAPVMKLAREAAREIAIAVPEHRIGELKQARAIAVSLWANPGKVYAARVREIAPAVDPVTRTFAARLAVVDPDAALEWGMTANVLLQGEGRAGTLVVPLTAIYHTTDGKPAVWVYDPNARTVSLAAVTLAGYRENGAIVASGIRAGDWLVAAGVNKLQPGQSVRPYETPGRPGPPAPGGKNAAAAKG